MLPGLLACVLAALLAVWGTAGAASDADITPDGIAALRGAPDGTRIIFVFGNGDRPGARLAAYEKTPGGWRLYLAAQARTGYNGIREQRKEGSGATPAGVFSFGRAFGTAPDPGSRTPYTQVTQADLWVDDPASRHYNRWARADMPGKDWRSAEKLADYPVAYKHAIAINYNTDPVVPGAGSAIFLHCFDKPVTLGCLSVPEQDMIRLLAFIDAGTHIVIAPHAAQLPDMLAGYPRSRR